MTNNRNAAYVAAGPIPPSRPPAPKAGVIRWLRRNLFNGALDSILTLISISAIVLLVPPLVDWAILKGVWNASSLDQCRQIVAAAHGEAALGACWAVINERIYQFTFGFYPPELYWRPVLAFVLLFVALPPVLFSWFPRKMLWFSLVYPVIAFVLIWGGLGLEVVKSARLGGFMLIIIPQALKASMPRMVRICVGIVRDTSLVSMIGLLGPVGLLNPIRADSNWNGILWELYVFVILFFWAFCFAISRYSKYLERKLQVEQPA